MSIAIARDYGKYPEAFIDTEHCDDSWLHMAKLMKTMGVKNHLFHLTTLQAELKGVDPHDPNLTEKQQLMVARECKNNLWYHARKVSRIPAKGGKPIRAKCNRMVLCAMWCMIMNIDVALVAPRQQGKSVGFDIDTDRTINISGENQDVILITKDAALRKVNVDRLKSMHELMPPYLNFTTNLDADNSETVTCKALGNRLLTGVAQKSKELADNLGRGMTSPLLRIDELAYIFNLQISLPVAAASGTQARTDAKENGTPYGLGVSTTPGKRDTDYGRYAYNLISGGYFWNEQLCDSASREDAIDVISTNSSGERAIVNGTFSHRQLNRSDSWLKDAIVNSSGTKESIMKDYLNHWPSGSESSPLDADILAAIKRSEKEPSLRERCARKFIMNWYQPKAKAVSILEKENCLITIDSSNASGRDANGMTICGVRSLAVLATSNIKVASLLDYGMWVAELMVKYPKLTLVIENKSSGQAILDMVADKLIEAGENPFMRIYNRIVDDPDRYTKAWADIKSSRFDKSLYRYYKGLFGFMTTGRSRAFLYDTVLHNAAQSVGHLVYDKTLIDQLAGLVEKRGRIDHQQGSHDDLVIAWLLCNYVAVFGKNLWFYKIPKGLIMAAVSSHGALKTKEELADAQQDAATVLKIEAAKELLVKATSSFEERMLAVRIEMLTKKIINPTEELNIDNILTEINDAKKNKLSEAVKKSKRKLSWIK